MRTRFGIGDGRDDDETAVGRGFDRCAPNRGGRSGRAGRCGSHTWSPRRRPAGRGSSTRGRRPVRRRARCTESSPAAGSVVTSTRRSRDSVGPGGPSPHRTISTAVGFPRWVIAAIVASRARSSAASGPAWSSTTTSPSDSAEPDREHAGHAAQLQLEVVEAHDATSPASPASPGHRASTRSASALTASINGATAASSTCGSRYRPGSASRRRCSSRRSGRRPARQHLAAESRHVDDHRGVAQLVLGDEVIEGQIDGGDARTPTCRVDQ